MKSFAVSVLLVSMPVIAIGGVGGIEEANSHVSASGTNSNIGSSIGLLGEARFPVSTYTGILINAATAAFSGKKNFLDSSRKSFGVGVLARKYDLGILQAEYRHGESEADLNPGSLKHKDDTYSLLGSYYVDRVDASLSYNRFDPDTGSSVDIYSLGATYYATDNASMGAFVHRDDSKDSYSLHLSYQPAMFDNDISIGLSYLTDNDIDSYSLSVSYFFGTTVSLIDRKRKY